MSEEGENAVASDPQWDEERLARAALGAVIDVGSTSLARLVSAEGAASVWSALRSSGSDSSWTRRARLLDLEGLVGAAERLGSRFVVPGDEEWPVQVEVLDETELGGMGGAPAGLWLLGPGRLNELVGGAVAIVGARAATRYGESVAMDLASDLAAARDGGPGRAVISGGAYGIDAAAHRGALSGDGRTIAVLACGLDQLYPRGNAGLLRRIGEQQLLVSESPVGTHPTRAGFLARNRLIAALSAGTIVVEAAARSGAANTARWTAACQRVVMAVPGPVHSGMSVTPHRLIRDQMASLVANAEDVQALLAPISQPVLLGVGGERRPLDQLGGELLVVREALPGRGTASTDEIAVRTGLSVADCLASLNELEDRGLVRADGVGTWLLARPSRSTVR